MTESVEKVARALWFEYVDQQGYPNGLPTWDEMLVGIGDGEHWPQIEDFRSLARAAQAALSAIPAAHQYGHLMTEGYFSDRAKQQIYSPAIPAQGDVVAWMYERDYTSKASLYRWPAWVAGGWTETPLVRQSDLTAAHARIAELEAREAEADKFAEVLAVIAYESPEEPWKVAYDALKSSARVIRGESSR